MVDIGSIFAEIELDLVRNLKGSLAEGSWRTQRLRALKQFQQRNLEALSKYPISEEAQRQIEQAYLQAGYKTRAEAMKILGKSAKASGTTFSVDDKRLQALIDQLNRDLTNAQTAAVRMMNDVYRETAAKAQVAMTTNLYTMNEAIDMATQDFLSRGINCIQYANGARVNIASYAEMALRTSTRRATLIGEGAMRAELGQNLVYVSQYGACSDTCLPWQGQVYWDDVYTPGAKPDDKYPRLSEAIGGGLFHPNCRHKTSTWYEGVSKIPPLMDEETVHRNSQLEAQQRYNERQIRKYKRMEEGSLDPVNQAKYANKVKQWQSRQRELIKENSDVLRRDYSREYIHGIGAEKKMPMSKAEMSGSSFFKPTPEQIKIQEVDGITSVEIATKSAKSKIAFYPDKTIFIDTVEIEQKGQGLGTKFFENLLKGAQENGYEKIQLVAAGDINSINNGYYTWARFGFDGELSHSLRKYATKELGTEVRTVQDIMKTQGGVEWWKKHGSALEMEFDLTKDSRSMKIWKKYSIPKGLV